MEKLKVMIDDSKINTLTVMIMEVPCCGGLIQLAKKALAAATRKIPVQYYLKHQSKKATTVNKL